ncbi:MAG: FG-GAP repeat domain-containing protein [Egibacteraceae bacterium]
MNPLVLIGLVCVIAAIVGGGLKLSGIEIPVLMSVRRQLLLASLGIALMAGVGIARLVERSASPGESGDAQPPLANVRVSQEVESGLWMVSSAATEGPVVLRADSIRLSDVAFGDFDGDGDDDAFRSDPKSGDWYVANLPAGEWRDVADSEVPLDDLVIGDFDGDGNDDFFTSDSKGWYVGYGPEGWQQISTFNVPVRCLAFGDFNGDGTDDALRSANGALEVSLSTRERTAWSGWTEISTSVASVNEVAIGDFNGDKIADVFRPDPVDRAWYISYGYLAGGQAGQSNWQRVGDSDIPLGSLAIGDFDGDDKDDVFRSDSGIWYVSYSALSNWEKVNTSDLSVSSLTLADVNGDNRTDVVYPRQRRPPTASKGPC